MIQYEPRTRRRFRAFFDKSALVLGLLFGPQSISVILFGLTLNFKWWEETPHEADVRSGWAQAVDFILEYQKQGLTADEAVKRAKEIISVL